MFFPGELRGLIIPHTLAAVALVKVDCLAMARVEHGMKQLGERCARRAARAVILHGGLGELLFVLAHDPLALARTVTHRSGATLGPMERPLFDLAQCL